MSLFGMYSKINFLKIHLCIFPNEKLIRQIKKQTDLNDEVNIALRIRFVIIIPYLSFLSPALQASLSLNKSFCFPFPGAFIISKIDL